MSEVQIRIEDQQNEVADEVSALLAVVRPILSGILFSLKADVVGEAAGFNRVKLKMLPRLYRRGDGDCGICFEYAVHDAILRGEASVLERVSDGLKRCKVPGNDYASILFGAEKNGATSIIATAETTLTDDSRILTGERHQPPKLKSYLNRLAAAFRRPTTRAALPYSINGLWKADLFLGTTDRDRWVGTSVKINAKQLEGANGLRVGIVPCRQGLSDSIHKIESKNIIVCPIPYDGEFMEIFYQAWGLVQQFIFADAKMPSEVSLPISSHRQVVSELVARREHPVVDVVDALIPIAQPGLLKTVNETKTMFQRGELEPLLSGIIMPVPNINP
jgi:hypothetical protein